MKKEIQSKRDIENLNEKGRVRGEEKLETKLGYRDRVAGER